MSKNIDSLQRVRRHTLASAAALAFVAAAPAMADSMDDGYYRFGQYDGSIDQTLALNNYVLALTSPQLSTGFLAGTAVGVSYQALLSGSAGMGTSVTQAGNSISALANGNQSASSIALGLVAPGTEGADGAAIMSGQVRRDAASQATVVMSGVGIRLDNMPVAAQVISANTLSATTTLNQSASTIEGVLPAGYNSSRAGRVSSGLEMAGYGGESNLAGASLDSRSTASLGITTAQVSLNAGQRAGSGAVLADSGVTLVASGQGGQEGQSAMTAPLSITGNQLSAQYTGNRASSQFNAQASSAPLAASVVVSNLQANIENGTSLQESGPGATALVADTAIRADLRGGEGYRSELAGALAITGNSVLAGSIGNNATARDASGAPVAGNSIVVAGGAGNQGLLSPRFNIAGTSDGSGGSHVMADLALSSVQGNRDTGFASEVNQAAVSAQLDHLAAGGSVAVDGNAVAATATGNAAGNRIQAEGSSLWAGAAASNVQANSWTDVAAANLGTRIETSIGTAGRAVGGTVSLSANRLDAAATGNVADTRVALSATHLATGGWPASAGAFVAAGGFGIASGDATVVNAQANQGGAISALLANGGVAAVFADQWSGEGAPVGLQASSLTLRDNTLRSQAVGNDATTGVSLAATTATTSAAIASMQVNSARVSSELAGMAVSASAGNLWAASVALDGNLLASAAVANRANNRLLAQLGTLQSGSEGMGGIGLMGIGEGEGGGGANSASRDMGSAVATFALVNAQRNDAAVDSRNLTEGALVQASVGSGSYGGQYEGETWPGIVASTVSVKGNAASAASTGNQAANTLSLQADSLSATGVNAPVAALNNVQSGSTESRSKAVAGGIGGGLLIGARFTGQLDSSTVSVTGNTVSAANLGNTASNRLEAAGTNLAASGGLAVARDLRGDSTAGMVQNDFSLVNQQSDAGAGRSASTRHVAVGIEDGASGEQWTGVFDSTLTVSGNRNLAQARNNDAVNAISLAGYSTLGAGAGLLNSQDSASRTSASASGRFRIRASDSGVFESALALTDNVTQALAVANSADNSIAVQATTLQGNGAGESAEAGNGVASAAGFALGNVQSHGGVVEAAASSSNRINLDSSSVFGTSAGVSGNLVAGIAQANSANNTLALASTTASGVTGAIASVQSASGRVSASADAPTADGTFFVRGQSMFGTQVTVSNNSMRASAGQNEAFNQQTVTAASIGGNNPSAFKAGPSEGSGGVGFSVASQQTGAGNVDASAMPAQIGVVAGGVFGGSLTVSGNQVAAKANVNTASNALTLAASGALGAGGSVSNLQSAGSGPVTATIGSYESMTLVGAMPSALNGTAVAVTGNSLAAQAGGNNGANVLSASGAMAATRGAATPSFAVLNNQSNASAMNAAVRNATIGVVMNGYEGMGMNSASASVQANSVTASGYGNTASNAIALAMPQLAGGAATASLVSRQANTAPISALVSNVTIGLVGAGANGSSAVISGNSVSAQAIGNAVVNAISVK